MMLIGLCVFFVGFWSLTSYRKSMLVMLLSIEYMVLGISLMLIQMMKLMADQFILLYFFVFVVCEGALGLSLIVVLIRAYGTDLILNMNMTKC
uniref:NADH-ubiquinone oxidoreductase chain 4L n=1 Tax=Anaulaciulus koreanus TaxID=1977246 RepID=A0A1W5T113_9MYRI|nr:NADH dehydrogenase subunit 4L [Anaulaciulus koreanus]ARF02899.1 NADH dehydrogenase subunit 4L [Anaulaciulus koreanus]